MTDNAPTPRLPESAVPLDGGGRMPLLGFGTWRLKGDEAVAATAAALDAGYRHLDTATVYHNEAEVGKALAGSGIAREEVFLTTKCPPKQAGNELATLRRSLDMLGTGYVDLWLIHWPHEAGKDLDIWRAFVEAREAGLARQIGVSNFSVEHVDALTAATGVAPAVNQVEWSPLLFDPTVLEEHRRRDVALEGYSALRGGALEHPTILRIAEGRGRTAAQVVIRWHLQHGVVVIPRSRRPEHIRSNADVGGFELSADEMAALDGLGSPS